MATAIVNPILETLNDAGALGMDVDLPAGIISADSHVTEPPHCCRDYIDSPFAIVRRGQRLMMRCWRMAGAAC
ncbi:DNA-directed RNA polymerase alpha subunit [Sphingobium sp. OAS761]|nr:DNA-directed RNA polymerase alpha subunit [Sphingobium sp. OAS761]